MLHRKLRLLGSLLPCATSVLTAAEPAPTPAPPGVPNVVLIISDDQGLGDLGCMGNPVLKTPALDRLHGESSRLTNFVVCPLCAPSRAALMTGRYNYRGGVWDTWLGRSDLNTAAPTLGELYSARGYHTGLFGKWHLGDNAPMLPRDRGFERSVLFVDSSRIDARLDFSGEVRPTKGFFEDVIFTEALDFMAQSRDRPFLAVITSYMPHDHPGRGPQVPEKWAAPYRAIPGLAPGDAELYGMVANLDSNVNRVLAWLREHDREKDTIVIFLSDNGPVLDTPDLVSRPERLAIEQHHMGSRFSTGLRGTKTTVFEGGIRVPFFIRWPGHIPAGRDVAAAAAHIDLAPTLLTLCGLALPAAPSFDGVDLSRIILGQEPPEHWDDRVIVIQQDRSETPAKWVNSAVRQGGWKLINGTVLYHLATDPAEKSDVATQFPARVAQLRQEYETWWDSVTTDQPFHAGRTELGAKGQQETLLNIYLRPPAGWPVKVKTPGTFTLAVDGLQPALLAPGSKVSLMIGGKTLQQTVPAGADRVTWEGVELSAGDSVVDVKFDQPLKPAKMYYGNEDLGWRSILIKRTNR